MPGDLEAWEKTHGKIPDDVILLVFTNWGKYWPDKKKYLGTDTDDIDALHFPGKAMKTGKAAVFLQGVRRWGRVREWLVGTLCCL